MNDVDVQKLLDELRTKRFWGTVAFVFQNGEMIFLRKEETVKISERKTHNGNYSTIGSKS